MKTNLRPKILRVTVVLLRIYLLTCLALFLFQRQLLYFPGKHEAAPPETKQRLAVPGADLVLNVHPGTGTQALLYFGGNAEDVSWAYIPLAQQFPEHTLYLMHYRGYGGSTGTPSEAALHQDALALFDKVHRQHPEITVIGRSLGSGVAIKLASQRPVTQLILITPYDSIERLAQKRFPFVPVHWLLQDKFESWRYAPAVKAPTRLLIAAEDEIVPMENSLTLFHAFQPGIAQIEIIPGAGHGDAIYP